MGITVQPVILCGGSGTRLWPLSRSGFPKQFLVLSGNQSLFQQSIERMYGLGRAGITVESPLVIGNEEHRFLVLDQMRETRREPRALLLEPCGRNTAPALTLAALAARDDKSDPILVVTPADQTVSDVAEFSKQLGLAIQSAATGGIVILGVQPDRPESGYGYIHAPDNERSEGAVRPVSRFVEKPDTTTAVGYLAEGGYYWNAGIFVLKASVWLDALERFRPDILAATRRSWDVHSIDNKFVRPGGREFSEIPSESIDYAVMEHCPGSEIDIRMVPLAAGWNDLGAWDAVWQVTSKDERGNASIGDVLQADSSDTLVHATSRLVGIVGLENVIVIETSDAVLVADRSRSQDVKKIVGQLDALERDEHTLHRKVHRPWGWYDSIDQGHRFKVKRIQVKPGASLSLQKHHHRAEHWIVVSGTAEITCGEKIVLLTENQSTYIPLGELHRLANPGTIPLEIIEVQSGSYLGEDDIVRFEDSYGRIK